MKNKLMVYQGGGDSRVGCLWEWNAAVWDADGKFRDVVSTGCGGLWSGYKSHTAAEREALARKWIDDVENSPELIDLEKERAVVKFYKDYAPQVAYTFMKKLYEDVYDKAISPVYLFWVCTECGHKLGFDEEVPNWEDAHGNGGIGITYDAMLCEQCYSAGCCDKCNEYHGVDNLTSRLCSWCHDKAMAPVSDDIEQLDADIQHVKDVLAEYKVAVPKAAAKATLDADKIVRRLEAKKRKLIREQIDGC